MNLTPLKIFPSSLYSDFYLSISAMHMEDILLMIIYLIKHTS